MRRIVLAALWLAAAAPRAGAQSNTAALLQRARTLYENLDIEAALPILRQIISPSSPFAVTTEQRVEAYKFLGASLANLGQRSPALRDSATIYFLAAIERDPFTDLDPQTFDSLQIAAFAQAKQRVFAMGVRSVPPARFDPRTQRLTFLAVTTHAAASRVELRLVGSATRVPLFDGENAGPRELDWNGLLPDGTLAPTGRYELAVLGQSRLSGRADSVKTYFNLVQEVPPLEDTLPQLRPQDLLPERYPTSAAAGDLFKGLGVAAAAVLIPAAVGNRALGRGGTELRSAAAGAGVLTGVVAFVLRQRNRDIPANIEANRQRLAARHEENRGIAERNRAKREQTMLVVTPAAGVGQ